MMGKIKTAIYLLINDPLQIPLHLNSHRFLNWMPDRYFLKLQYYCKTGKKLDLDQPVTFNEKLQWLKLHDRNPAYTQMVDKYEVRKYIAEKLGEEYLVPLLGVYDNFDEIDFDELPNQFVLKCTHDSGGNVICTDKSNLDFKAAKNKMDEHMHRNYYYWSREWVYKNVTPRIVCEEYIVDEASHDLKDYKIFCFHGKPMCCCVCSNRHTPTGMNMDFYDLEWNWVPFGSLTYPSCGQEIAKPKNFDKMIEFAAKLSAGIPYLRTDFYDANGKLYFGELTFCPCSGYDPWTPGAYYEMLSSWLNLATTASENRVSVTNPNGSPPGSSANHTHRK